MEVAFYNETMSPLNQDVEIYHAFVFSLFADKIFLMCHNSTWYHLLNQKDKWNDNMIKALYQYFETAHDGKYGLHYENFDEVFSCMAMAKKLKQKSRNDFNIVQTGSLLKKNMKEIFVVNLEEVLQNRRVFGLQKLIDNDVVKMYSMLSIINSERYNLYIKEIREMFMEMDDYLIFGETVKVIYKLLTPDQARTMLLPNRIKEKFDVISIELLDLPLLSDIGPDHIYYLRGQLYPEFAEFRKRMDIFRDEITEMRFEPVNFKRLVELYRQHIGCLLAPLQSKIEQQLFVQLTRNLYRGFGFKLNLGITSVSCMIDYFPKSGIVPVDVADAARRMLDRETDLSRSELFFYIDFYTQSQKF